MDESSNNDDDEANQRVSASSFMVLYGIFLNGMPLSAQGISAPAGQVCSFLPYGYWHNSGLIAP
jgi:hypothetical protein